MKRYGISVLILFFLTATIAPAQDAGRDIPRAQSGGSPRNVIILIAEGLGLTQVSAGIYTDSLPQAIERFPFTGLQKALSKDALIANAGAEATAISCGIATSQGLIGLNEQKKPVKNIFEEAKNRGFSTGIISTDYLTAAAPAAFIAHRAAKAGPEAIAEAYLSGHIDFFIGAGRKYFEERSSDARNLITELEAKGFVTSNYQPEEISNTTYDFRKDFAAFFEIQGILKDRENFILPATRLAGVYLKNHSRRNGFILVIHYSQLFESGLKNDSENLLLDLKAFDKITNAALDFASGDGETLVVATGTPEAGGAAINPGSEMGRLSMRYGTKGPTGAMIPVFAYGPGAFLFTGVYDNTVIHRKISQALGWQ